MKRRLFRIGNLALGNLNRISGGLAIMSAICVIAIVTLVSADVIFRYIFLRPFAWCHEVVLIFQVLLVWMGVAYVLREEGHIEVHIITGLLSPRVRARLKVYISAVSYTHLRAHET